ncbi:MAG: molybdenum cofactor biosynthesis protein MoaE [Bradyrhizobiaceae bacterium]|nr:molybdenum cofactor biosynthesis protein MoaE [Bradyrhizobiaceae bacterium]
MTVRITEQPFDPAAEAAALSHGRTDIGAVVAFSGICRDSEGHEKIASLTLEHYPGMAEAEIARHVEEAEARWPLLGVRVVHRVGRIMPGETIVFVACASKHRQAAFAAAEFLMDYLKTRAPFWKKVEAAGGVTWVEAQAKDDAAAARWTRDPKRDAAE